MESLGNYFILVVISLLILATIASAFNKWRKK